MFGRLLSKLFGRNKGAAPAASTSRPVSPPAPSFAASAPPPPPPPPVTAPISAPIYAPVPEPDAPPVVVPEQVPEAAAAAENAEFPSGEGGRVKLILDDGTLTSPSLDPELEERLRYIVDNIVPPAAAPPEGPST